MTALERLQQTGIRRVRSGKGFAFRTAQGKPVAASELPRIRKLAIPPAWTDVHVAPVASAKLQAIGKDKAGRWLRGQVPQTRGLSRKRNPLLKSAFKGAATTVILQMPEHPLHAAYQRMLGAGIKPNLAKLTLARRIAAIVLSMWKHKEVYDPQRQATPAKV